MVQHFGMEATFSALRTLVIICFGPDKDQAQTHVLHAEQSFDCDRLYLVCVCAVTETRLPLTLLTTFI
mgnify:CR=1 FL=1